MGVGFWARRFALAWSGAFALIGAAHFARGRTVEYSVTEAGIWSILTAIVFVAARAWQSRRGQHCALCRDTPEMRDAAARRAAE